MNSLQRILYVEDEPDIQAVARLALEIIGGLTVKICSSGNDAVRSAEAFAPQLLLLDVMMPGMDGPTTLESLRKLPSLTHVPAIFMTAKAQSSEIIYFKSLGACDVIAKPFDPLKLAAHIKAIWGAFYD